MINSQSIILSNAKTFIIQKNKTNQKDMKKITRRLMTTLGLLCLAMVVFAQQQQIIPTDPKVRIGKLENGLTYYIRHNNLPENRADFYIAQKVGSILEDDNQRGLAHFLEHMCFNGTTNFPGKGIINWLESIGVRFGQNLNAYTSIEETVYNISDVPLIRESVVDSCLLILHDWANDLTLAEKEIDSERGVIHEEWRSRQNATMRIYDQILPKCYQGEKYAYRMPIGVMEVVDNFPYQALRDYYEKWYRPDQQGIIVVGDIDVDKIEAKIKEIFSSIEMPKNPAVREYLPVSDNKEPIIAYGKDKEFTSTAVQIYYKHPAFPNDQKNTVQYMVQNYMISMACRMLNGRLGEMTQVANPPFISASVGHSDFLLSKTTTAFTGSVSCKENEIPSSFTTLMREIERAKKFGFTASEYERAKANYLTSVESAYSERNKIKNGSYVNAYVRHFIDNEPIAGLEVEYPIAKQIAAQIPVEAINQVIPQLITKENIVMTIFGPDKEGVTYPSEQELLDIIKNVQTEELTAYVDKVSNEPLLSEEPTGGKIVKTEKGVFGSTVLTLSNGIRVIMKPTEFKADQIQLQAVSPGGTSVFGTEDVEQIRLLNNIAGLGGYGKFSLIDLSKVLAGKKVSMGTSVGTLTENVSGSCSPKDFETMMQLIYLGFTAPRMDNEALESYKQRLRISLANQEGKPMTALQDTITKVLYNNHPMLTRMKADVVDRIDYEKIIDMYKNRFEDASDFTFFLVGNINFDEVNPLIEKYLGGLPTTNRKETFQDLKMDIQKGKRQVVFNQKQETPLATVILVNSGKVDYNLKNKLLMTCFTRTMDMVYTEEVREKEGGTYGVGVSGSVSKHPKEQGLVEIQFNTDPSKREKMVEIITRELENAAANGPKEEHLNKVKEAMIKQFAESVKENGYWMGALNEYYWRGVDMNTNYTKLIESITTKDVKKFAKKLLKQGNMIEVSMTTDQKE